MEVSQVQIGNAFGTMHDFTKHGMPLYKSRMQAGGPFGIISSTEPTGDLFRRAGLLDEEVLDDAGRCMWMSAKPFDEMGFRAYMFVEIIDWEEYDSGDAQYKYSGQVSFVAPSQVNRKERERALDSVGVEITDQMLDCRNPTSERRMAIEFQDYGLCACIVDVNGDDLDEVKHQTFLQAATARSMCGFYMDRPLNLIGTTGWDFISGNIWPK